jgi:hypothetical protein
MSHLSRPAAVEAGRALYMFGATVTTDWRTGSPITWTGEWNGQPFEDKVAVTLTPEGPGTRVELVQSNIASHEVQEHSEAKRHLVLGRFKEVVERDRVT